MGLAPVSQADARRCRAVATACQAHRRSSENAAPCPVSRRDRAGGRVDAQDARAIAHAPRNLGPGSRRVMSDPTAAGPDVLVVVPTLGRRERMLRESVCSLLGQTRRCRVLIVAGGETDRVEALAASLGVPWIEQRGTGLAAAIEDGWRGDAGHSDQLSWLGDDDRLPPRSIEIASRLLEAHPEASMVYGRARFIDDSGQTLHVNRPDRKNVV